jgi:putative intracellular protease/amidase
VAHLCVPHRAMYRIVQLAGILRDLAAAIIASQNTLRKERKEMTISSTLPSNETPLELGIVLYPGMTLLDFAGPQRALGLHGYTHLLWKTLEPVKTDLGISVLLTATFANSRKDFDVLLVPEC